MNGIMGGGLLVLVLAGGGGICWLWRRAHLRCFSCAAWIAVSFRHCPHCGQRQFAPRRRSRHSDAPEGAAPQPARASREPGAVPPRRTVVLSEPPSPIAPTVPWQTIVSSMGVSPSHCPRCRQPIEEAVADYCGRCGSRITRRQRR